MRMIFPCFSVSVVMNDPKVNRRVPEASQIKKCWLIQCSPDCGSTALSRMLADPDRKAAALLTLFPVISGTRSPAGAGGRNRLAGNHRPPPQARAGRRPCHSSQHSGTLSCIIRTGLPAGSIMSTGGNVPWTLD